MNMLSHRIVLYHCALYRVVAHDTRSSVHYIATDIDCATVHYIVPTGTLAHHRALYRANSVSAGHSHVVNDTPPVTQKDVHGARIGPIHRIVPLTHATNTHSNIA